MGFFKKLFYRAIGLTAAAAYLYVENTTIATTRYTVPVTNLPSALQGLRIAHLSDIHMPKHQIDLDRLTELVREQEPQLIVITGDLVFGNRQYDRVTCRRLFERLVSIAPTYVTFGNHEKYYKWRPQLIEDMAVCGVIYLQDATAFVEIEGQQVAIVGLEEKPLRQMQKPNLLEGFPSTETAALTVLLAHCPERFLQYLTNPQVLPDVTLVGHAHGGQIRVPFVGGLYAPGQGFMPKYTEGIYSHPVLHDKLMVISRGLGPSSFPVRVNNRPELVVVDFVTREE